ncbi:hypothetical protein FDECE_2608 [Fusarium decemcellulare]|nr:hypothetical protein FDECE_2608 [Fusarium decemcellulare]
MSSDELLEHAKRAGGPTVEDYVGLIPGCDKDPSTIGAPIPGWAVNAGVKIPKEGDDDQCTSGSGGDYYWTEYRLVEAAIKIFVWRKSGPKLRCSAKAHSSYSITI